MSTKRERLKAHEQTIRRMQAEQQARLNRLTLHTQAGNESYARYMEKTKGYGPFSIGRARELAGGVGNSPFLAQMQLQGRTDVIRSVRAQVGFAASREANLLEDLLLRIDDPDEYFGRNRYHQELYRMLERGTTNPEAWEESRKAWGTKPDREAGEKIWVGKHINEQGIWGPPLKAMQETAVRHPSWVASLGKPEDVIQGRYFNFTPEEVSPAGAFLRRNKAAAYHVLTNPTIQVEGAAGWSKYRFDSSIPRYPVTPMMHEVRQSGVFMGRPLEVMARQVIVSPKQAWSQAVAGGALETEHIFLNEMLSHVAYDTPRKAGVAQMGPFNALTDVLGQRVMGAGSLSASWSKSTGIDALTSGPIMGNPMLAMQGMLEHMVTLADVKGKAKLHQLRDRLSQHGVADLVLPNKQTAGPVAIWQTGQGQGLYAAGTRRMQAHLDDTFGHGPRVSKARYAAMSPHQRALRGSFMLLREISRDIDIEQPFAHAEFTTASGKTVPGRALVGSLRPRFDHTASQKAMRMDPSMMLGLASQGKASSEIAQAFLDEAVEKGGDRAREFFAILNPVLNRSTDYAGFQRVGASQLDGEVLAGLGNNGKNWNIWDLGEVLGDPTIPDSPLLLKLPESIHISTPAFLGEIAKHADIDAADRAALLARQGAPTRVLALPNIRKTMQNAFHRALDEGADDVFLTPLVGQAGKIIQAVQNWEGSQVGAGATQVQAEVETYLKMMADHTSNKGLIHDVLNPRVGKGAYYRGLVQGQVAQNLPAGAVSPTKIGMAQVGLSEASLMEDFGLSRKRVDRIMAGTEDFFLHQQYYPQVSPGTSGIVKVRALSNAQLGGDFRKGVLTHAADRLMGYRDVDVDPIHLQMLPKGISKQLIEQAHQENLQLTKQFWGSLPSEARSAWLGQEAAYQRGGALRAEPMAGPLQPGKTRPMISTGTGTPMRLNLDEVLARGEFAGLTDEGAKKVLKSKAAPGILYEETMRLREIMFGQHGPKSYPGQAVIAPAYQMAGIKKTAVSNAFGELHAALKDVPAAAKLTKAQIQEHATRIAPIADRLAAAGAASDVHTGVTGPARRKGLEQLVQAAGVENQEKVLTGMSKLAGGGSRLEQAKMYKAIEDVRGGYRNTQWGRMIGLGKENTPALTALNRALKEAGSDGAAAGGVFGKAQRFWSKLPKGGQTAAKWGAAGLGALLGLRVAKSTVFGDEPGPPGGMRPMSPELQARMAMQQTEGLQGSPLPPDPMVGQGIHHQAQPLPYVQMSPPPARVTDTRQINSKMRIHATDTAGIGPETLGSQMAGSMGTPLGVPSVDIFAPDDRIQSRLALNNEMQMRKESRFYAS